MSTSGVWINTGPSWRALTFPLTLLLGIVVAPSVLLFGQGPGTWPVALAVTGLMVAIVIYPVLKLVQSTRSGVWIDKLGGTFMVR